MYGSCPTAFTLSPTYTTTNTTVPTYQVSGYTATEMPTQYQCCCQPMNGCSQGCNNSCYGCAGELVTAIVGITIIQSILALIFGGFCGSYGPPGPGPC